jgi:hypothetical protein
VARTPHGAWRAWGLALTGGGPLEKGREAGEQLIVGGCGGERRGRAWAGRERKMEWAEPG